jgi:hypothetical protein
MLCVAAMKNPGTPPTAAACEPYLNLFHAGFIIVVDDRDLSNVLEIAGMPCVAAETVNRDFYMVFIAGNLMQWRSAMLRGCQKDTSIEARHIFNLIYSEFKRVGVAAAFGLSQKENSRDRSFLLEHRP